MKCRRSEELWSDYLEKALPAPLTRDLEEHLESCTDCSRGFDTFREVVGLLWSLPRPQPAPGLLNRILASTRPRLAAHRPLTGSNFPGLPLPPWGSWAVGAAGAALFLVLFLHPPAALSGFEERLNLWIHRTYSFGLRAYRGSERLMDELNVVRMAVGVAFEDRLDRINERLKDLENARRKSEEAPEESSFLIPPRKLTQVEAKTNNTYARSLL